MDLTEFNTLAGGTRLSKDSREAARLVFVDGLPQVEAAQQMQISSQRMNQIVATIRREQEKQRTVTTQPIDVLGTSYAVAVKAARDQFGDDVVLQSPADGRRTVGPVVARTDFHVVQHIGRDSVVVHDLAKLDRAPAVGRDVAIEYAAGRGAVVDRAQGKERGGVAR